jgi:indolepyruvate ferredoxin oxidoreductase
MRRFRGTALDLFGRTSERRQERALIGEYERLVDELLAQLAPHNYELAVSLASIPEYIRGYGHVRERHLKDAKAREQALLERFRGTSQAVATDRVAVAAD